MKYDIKKTTKLGITRDVIDLWVKNSSQKNISDEEKSEIISKFLLGDGILVV